MAILKLAINRVQTALERYETDLWDPEYLEETLESLQEKLTDHLESLEDHTYYEYGKLYRTGCNRWAIKDYELTCGSVFYVFYLGRWVKVQMEAAAGKYYTIPNVPLSNNMKARVKKY